MRVVTIVGAGMMGTAMCRPATDNGHAVRLVGTPLDQTIIDSVKATGFHPTLKRQLPDGVTAYAADEMEAALDGCDLVVGGVSSFGVDWFAEVVLPKLKDGTTVLLITKGLYADADGGLVPFPRFLSEKRPGVSFLAVGGPCICFELFDRRQTVIYFCGDDIDTVRSIKPLFATDYYHIVPSSDVVSIECGVAMKNAYAMGVSLAVGIAEREKGVPDASQAQGGCAPGAPDLNPVFNPQAALFAQSCLEMRRLVDLLGGDPLLIAGLCGAGDLYVTVFGGRTRKLGTLLGRGLPCAEVRKILQGVTLEAVTIITRVAAALRVRAKKGCADLKCFPLLMQMDAVLNEGAAVRLDWDAFG